MPKLDDILKDNEEEEEVPDVEIKIPANKVKYMVGQGGEKIKWIQRKSKARVQVSPRLGAVTAWRWPALSGRAPLWQAAA